MSATTLIRGGVTVIAMVMALQVFWVREGYSDGIPRVITADETMGLPGGDLTSATDSDFGSVCPTANEDHTACFGDPYNVSSDLVDPAFRAAGGVVGVNLCEVLTSTCALDGADPNNTISDQLYLSVGAQNGNTNSLTWCWDSDLEPNINICQAQITVPPTSLFLVLEPAFGFVDLTQFFTAPNGPLTAGDWQILARSESAPESTPEPGASLLLAASVVGLLGYGWRRRKQGA